MSISRFYCVRAFFSLRIKFAVFLLALFVVVGCDDDEPERIPLSLVEVSSGGTEFNLGSVTEDISVSGILTVVFSAAVDRNSTASGLSLLKDGSNLSADIDYFDNDKTLEIRPTEVLEPNTLYTLTLSDAVKGATGETFEGRSIQFRTSIASLSVTSVIAQGVELLNVQRPTGIQVSAPTFEITFSAPVDPASVDDDDFRITGYSTIPVTVTFLNENRTVNVIATGTLGDLRKYELSITNEILGTNQESFNSFTKSFYTAIDPTPDFPAIADDVLLTEIQKQTFRYFWDFGHPVSGLARERNSSGDIVTSGGSGFGLMAIIVGIERSFITREQGIERLHTIVDFLETADRFHGAWSHWLNGSTGTVVPFSANDNGGDLVETSFLIQGLLTFRQYLDPANASEQSLIQQINALWEDVEWDWYTQGGQDVLYWHWSPDKEWIMNHQIKGYNESLITYVLGASSPTHSIDPSVYHRGWASEGGMVNGKTYYDYQLPLGFDFGGPLFFSHYSFVGLDPRNLGDIYASYWDQNVSHTMINRAYVIDNPKGFVGYSEDNWGLTASDNQNGYSAHSPTNDLGVITPTGAISSLPYAPEESMDAIRFFYYTLGDRLWGEYGFYDAFNITDGWTANSYLAIDQGPIIIMIENHRTGLLWDLFMSAPEIQSGLDRLGFDY